LNYIVRPRAQTQTYSDGAWTMSIQIRRSYLQVIA
jgi:hypothetical protein